MRRFPIAWLALVGLGLIAIWSWWPTSDRYWGAISPAYVSEALSDLRWGTRWRPVPFCWHLDPAGSVRADEACGDYLRRYPTNAICAVQNLGAGGWDPEVVHGEAAVAASNIAAMMKSHDCHWLVLDVESLHAPDRDRFSQWSAELVDKLRGEIPGLRSTVAVHGKTDDRGSWEGATAQDWRALCRAHDEILIMAYDFNYPGVTPPGETAPLGWVESVLNYTLTVCRPDQMRLGLAAYGYDWPTKSVVTERAAKRAPRPEAFVETERQRREKIALAGKLGVTRFFLWAMGME